MKTFSVDAASPGRTIPAAGAKETETGAMRRERVNRSHIVEGKGDGSVGGGGGRGEVGEEAGRGKRRGGGRGEVGKGTWRSIATFGATAAAATADGGGRQNRTEPVSAERRRERNSDRACRDDFRSCFDGESSICRISHRPQLFARKCDESKCI